MKIKASDLGDDIRGINKLGTIELVNNSGIANANDTVLIRRRSDGQTLFELKGNGNLVLHIGEIHFDADGDTKIAYDSTNGLTIWVDGTEVARFKSNGDVDGNGTFNDSGF